MTLSSKSADVNSWRNVFSWKSLFDTSSGADVSGSIVDRLYLSNVLPSSVASIVLSDAEYSPVVRATWIIAGATSVFVASMAVKSIATMVIWQRRLRDAKTLEPATGPKPLPFIGNILELQGNYYETLYTYVDKPAAVFWVMSTPFVIVNDADCIRTVLGGADGHYSKPKYFGYRSRVVETAMKSEEAKVAAESVDYTDGGDTSRKALRALVEKSFPAIKSSMERLMGILAELSEKYDIRASDEPLGSVRQVLVELNLNILFGLDTTGSEARRISDMIGFSGAEFGRRMVNPMRVFVDMLGNLRFVRDVVGLIRVGHKLCKKLDETVMNACMAAQSTTNVCSEGSHTSESEGLNWVQAWVGKVGKIGKLGKVVGLLMASSQTVPMTAVWMLYLVANNEAVREQLHSEITGLGVRCISDLTFDNLDKLTLTHAVVCETLRMFPPFPLIQRQAQVDDVLGGITVPAGTHVYIVPWLIHRHPKLWSTPHEFKPSRFVDGNQRHGDAPSDWAYLPFGRGPRMCAGSQLALAELKILLVTAILGYEWTSNNTLGTGKPFPALGMVPHGITLTVRRL